MIEDENTNTFPSHPKSNPSYLCSSVKSVVKKSGAEVFVKVHDDQVELLAKELMHITKPALGVEGCAVKVFAMRMA